MNTWLIVDVVLALGATLRITRAITVDAIGGRYLRWPAERWAERWAERGHPDTGQRARRNYWADALSCPWCVSPWLGIAAFTTLAIAHTLDGTPLTIWRIVAAGLTASYLVAHLLVAVGDVNDDEPADAYSLTVPPPADDTATS